MVFHYRVTQWWNSLPSQLANLPFNTFSNTVRSYFEHCDTLDTWFCCIYDMYVVLYFYMYVMLCFVCCVVFIMCVLCCIYIVYVVLYLMCMLCCIYSYTCMLCCISKEERLQPIARSLNYKSNQIRFEFSTSNYPWVHIFYRNCESTI